jgi:hypothetical protein
MQKMTTSPPNIARQSGFLYYTRAKFGASLLTATGHGTDSTA